MHCIGYNVGNYKLANFSKCKEIKHYSPSNAFFLDTKIQFATNYDKFYNNIIKYVNAPVQVQIQVNIVFNILWIHFDNRQEPKRSMYQCTILHYNINSKIQLLAHANKTKGK